MKHPKMFSASCRRLLMIGIGVLIWMMLTPPLVFGQQSGKLISLKLDKVTVLDAIKEINRLSGNSVSYKREELEKEVRQVSLELKDVQIIKAVEAVLQGTRLVAIAQGEIILIVPRKDNTSAKKSVRVKGFVYDTYKQPLPGVTVKVVGVSMGTATNEKGWFSIELPLTKGALEFSFVGFKNKTIEFSEKTAKDTLRITLEEDIQALDETVVVAYGNTTKREATGAISVVKADELKGIPSTDIASLLQGRVAGLDITNMSGAPGGSGTAITIRGYNSLDVEQGRRFSNPLWVVDGVPLNSFASPVTGTNMLADINPDMIESIQILKDASSASLYGSRAANGVIIVTTKKGRNNQKATFSANVSQSWGIVPEFPTITIGKGEREFRLKTLANYKVAFLDKETQRYRYPVSNEDVYWNGTSQSVYDYFFNKEIMGPNMIPYLQDSLNPFYNNSTNYFPVYFQTGKVTNANLQTYGGGEAMSYGIGLGYYNETGVFVGTGFNRIDVNSSMNVKPVKNVNVDMRFNATLNNRKRGEKSDGLGSAPIVEKVPGDPYSFSSLYPGEGSEIWEKTLEKLRGTKEKNRSVRLRSNFKVSYRIIEGLDLSASLAADYSVQRRNYFQPSYLDAQGYSMSIGETAVYLMALNENTLSFRRTFKEKHTMDAIIGFSYQYDQNEYNGGSARNSPSDKIYYAPGGMSSLGYDNAGNPIAFKHYESDMYEKILMSYFGRVEYNYMQKYLFSFSMRGDGSSVFGRNNKWGIFPAIAAGWSFSEEGWVKDNLGWLSFGKVRVSWGRSGKHFEEPYLALGLMNTGQNSHLGESTLDPQWYDGYFNEDLSWEETDQYDFGLDLDMFNYRLGITLDYYYRYTDKLLYPVELTGDYNGFRKQWRNAAAISNEGIELLVKYEIFRSQDLFWKISVNGAKNWNRIEKSYNGKDLDFGITGKPLNRILGYKTLGYVNAQDELPIITKASGESAYLSPGSMNTNFYTLGDLRFHDTNGDGMITTADRVYLGSALPVFTGGIVSEFRYKNFDLSVSLPFSVGRHMVNNMYTRSLMFDFTEDYYAHPILMDLDKISFWQQPGDKHADYARLQLAGKHIFSTTPKDRDVEKVNYLKLKTLTMGYSLPKKWMNRVGVTDIRVFVSGENLWTWTNYSGIDPEVVDIRTGIDDGMAYPLARKFTLGLTVKF
ncbi:MULTISPECIES: SusC/RagA family TonB-linked outer membrane protein [Butyricimonas]|uniref:SusC/RagA family TonB-linked outer membrane protein n=1 Tax=Butyricimonas TaxID=574697 RepID=UPI001D06DCEA|nr:MULTISPECIES: SusC/RagA family TonB-linked outer membrane protein [Butyricimonas]MCB6974716.1 SusC/RagA family TonB-linked outer membrane protein [Butyricimonas synergistica]MCG4521430.1 SusC/RagA family TonB-linked outer membrane protein [Butyricimonas sp. DFI.6.44]